jgi:hypothetical protein
VNLALASLTQKQVHPQQTARVYHANVKTQSLFEKNAAEKLDAYYTLYQFPKQ